MILCQFHRVVLNKSLSNVVDAQPDLSFRWVHMASCWFCHEAAQMILCQFHRVVLNKSLSNVVDAQPDLSFRWVHNCVCLVVAFIFCQCSSFRILIK